MFYTNVDHHAKYNMSRVTSHNEYHNEILPILYFVKCREYTHYFTFTIWLVYMRFIVVQHSTITVFK